MRVLITGAGGFLGRRLTQALIERGELKSAEKRRRISELCLVDRVSSPQPRASEIKVRSVELDLADPACIDRLAAEGFDSVFHLGASLTLDAERDPGVSYGVNVEPLRRFMNSAAGTPKVVYPSSIAVFGGELPDIVGDHIAPGPTTAYGMHKAICELLIADYSRIGRIDGRALRLPIVLVRPGAPSPAISDLVAAIVREPLSGRDVDVPFDRSTRVPIASAGAVVRSLIALHDLDASALPPRRAMNMPALTVSVADMIDTLTQHRADRALGDIRFVPDPAVQTIVDGWPRHFVSETAGSLGIGADAEFSAVITDYLDHLEVSADV